MDEEQSNPLRLAASADAMRQEEIGIYFINGLVTLSLVVVVGWQLAQRRAHGDMLVGMPLALAFILALGLVATRSSLRRVRESAVLIYPDCIFMYLSGRTAVLDVTPGAELTLRQDQRRRRWVIAADGSLVREIRVPVAAFPTLPEFLSRHYRVTPREGGIGP